MLRKLVLVFVIALAMGIVTGFVAHAILGGVVGRIHGIVVASKELREEGFKIYGFDIDVGHVKDQYSARAEFAIEAPHDATIVLRVDSKGPIDRYVITIVDEAGHKIVLDNQHPMAKIVVKKGYNKFSAEITLMFKKVKHDTPFELTIVATTG